MAYLILLVFIISVLYIHEEPRQFCKKIVLEIERKLRG